MYARELLPRLATVLANAGHDVTFYAPRSVREAFPDHPHLSQAVVGGRRFWTQTKLSRALFRDLPDLLFLPIQAVPLYRPEALKVVATVHDLDFFDYPSMYAWGNRFLLRWFTRVMVRNATRIIAVSQATQSAILARYHRSPTDVPVVYHGVTHERFRPPQSDSERRFAVARVQAAYQIPAEPILYVGALQPRKNIVGLVSAFEHFRERGNPHHLVLVSGDGWQMNALRSSLDASKARDVIHRLWRVPVTDLPALYWNASLLVLPSFAEGFGLPVLEAMACGTPVVTSTADALTEIAGGSGLTANPRDAITFANAFETFTRHAREREAAIARGIARASVFSWERCASETAAVIEDALTV